MKTFACFGDSITSDQVTGIGTRVCELLQMKLIGNYACGYATASDWHEDDRNITPITLEVPPNTNTADNVLSNQIRRILADKVKIDHLDFAYIAISTNDGNTAENPVIDDRPELFDIPFQNLTRTSIGQAIRWAVETLEQAFPAVTIFLASPLQTWCDLPWMDYKTNHLKRDIIRDIAEYENNKFGQVYFIDSFFESGFEGEIARDHGEVHPDPIWKEKIAQYVANQIQNHINA